MQEAAKKENNLRSLEKGTEERRKSIIKEGKQAVEIAPLLFVPGFCIIIPAKYLG
jgi:hypothetical protein